MSTALPSESVLYGVNDSERKARKWREKLNAATTMMTMSTISTACELKQPTLVSCVENPPSAIAENAWQIASNQLMPAMRSATTPTAVMARYVNHSALAVSVMRGVSFSSFTGPGVSAL